MKKIAIVFGIFFWATQGFAQSGTNAQTIFKMFLFLEKENVYYKGIDPTITKNDSLYQKFSSAIYLKLDKLKVEKNSFQGESSSPKYNFYRLLLYDNKKRSFTDNVIYTRKLTPDEEQFFGVAVGGCDSYIIAINQSTGVGYRLMGFDINDFLAFTSDFIEEYNKDSKKKLSAKSLLTGYNVEDLDFECLYNGLNAKERDRKKYPCLKRAADLTPAH